MWCFAGKKWFVERVMVLESVGALEEAVFEFNCWLGGDGDHAKEVPLTGTAIIIFYCVILIIIIIIIKRFYTARYFHKDSRR
jgi:hypothetical protein